MYSKILYGVFCLRDEVSERKGEEVEVSLSHVILLQNLY